MRSRITRVETSSSDDLRLGARQHKDGGADGLKHNIEETEVTRAPHEQLMTDGEASEARKRRKVGPSGHSSGSAGKGVSKYQLVVT